MTEFLRTPAANFESLNDFPFPPYYHAWQDMRMHYLDEGPADGPVMLLTHGMPTWSYLYRDMIPLLVGAGYRCIAPDHLGFGRSDKPTDIHWYTIARHTEVLTSLITALDLKDITLVCQDWGGPIGLAQAATIPERFSRLVIMNTWLHHPDYAYSEGAKNWVKHWHEGGIFCRPKPNVALLLILSAGLAEPEAIIPAIVKSTDLALEGSALDMYDGFFAPLKGLPDEAYNTYRRFPLSIPVDNGDNGNGNGTAQTHHYQHLLAWNKPVNFIWGCSDDVFTEAWGRQWAAQMGATFDAISDAGHFLQNTHGRQVAQLILDRRA